jgi:hypothetical protein
LGAILSVEAASGAAPEVAQACYAAAGGLAEAVGVSAAVWAAKGAMTDKGSGSEHIVIFIVILRDPTLGSFIAPSYSILTVLAMPPPFVLFLGPTSIQNDDMLGPFFIDLAGTRSITIRLS